MSSHKRLTTFQKATALVPLALLSGAWTTSLTMTGTASAEGQDGKLPDGTSVPDQAIKAPASVSNPGEIAPGVPKGSADQVIAGASANGIPAAALAAYQRAAQVIDSADKGCNIDWTLIAAIGRVESNHGRYGGNTLDSNGVSRPGIYGIPLDGSNSTSKITDTDAGAVRQRPAVRPCRRPDAVHPLDLVGRRRGRRRRRQAQPAGHRRRGARDRGLPVLRQRGPGQHGRPAVGGLPLQPQPGVRRPGAVDHAGLRRGRLLLGADQLGRDDHVHARLRRLGARLRHDRLPLPQGQERQAVHRGAQRRDIHRRHALGRHRRPPPARPVAPGAARRPSATRPAARSPTRAARPTTPSRRPPTARPPRRSPSSTPSARSPRRRRSAAASSPASPATAR